MAWVMTQKFPTRLAEVSADWLTGVLARAGVLAPDDAILDWTATPVGVGIGMMGDISRLELHYSGSARPLDAVVIKFATQNPGNRAVAQGFLMYEREARFFQELVKTVGDVAPTCYFSDVDVASGDMVLVFEDLSGYRPGDQAQGCDLGDAEAAIAAVARLHAGTWDAPARPDLDVWPRVDGPVYLHGFGAGVAAGLTPALEAFSDSVNPEVAAAADRIKAAIPELHARMASGPQALVHGDFRLDNFMFGDREGQRPFVMLDFQAPIVTKSVHDVAYLLSQSMAIDLRRQNERRMVTDYHAQLVELGVEGYDEQQCWEDYRLAVLHCFEFAVVVAGTLDPSNERGRAWIGASLQRSSQAIVDLDLLSLIP